MGKPDENKRFTDQVEFDEGFFTMDIPVSEKEKPLVRGRGSQRMTKVLVMAESGYSNKAPKKGRSSKWVGSLKMKVIPDLYSKAITRYVKEHLESIVSLTTDDFTSYVDFKNLVRNHTTVVSSKESVETALPWVYIAISNAKRLLDIHHKLSSQYLQYYLNEFCLKFNKRCLDDKMFDTMVVTVISYNTDFSSKIYGRTLCG